MAENCIHSHQVCRICRRLVSLTNPSFLVTNQIELVFKRTHSLKTSLHKSNLLVVCQILCIFTEFINRMPFHEHILPETYHHRLMILHSQLTQLVHYLLTVTIRYDRTNAVMLECTEQLLIAKEDRRESFKCFIIKDCQIKRFAAFSNHIEHLIIVDDHCLIRRAIDDVSEKIHRVLWIDIHLSADINKSLTIADRININRVLVHIITHKVRQHCHCLLFESDTTLKNIKTFGSQLLYSDRENDLEVLELRNIRIVRIIWNISVSKSEVSSISCCIMKQLIKQQLKTGL